MIGRYGARAASIALTLALAGLAGCGSSSDDVCSGVGLHGSVEEKQVSLSSARARGAGVLGGTDWNVHASFPGALFWGEGSVSPGSSSSWQGTGFVLGFSPPAGAMITGALTVAVDPSGTLPDLEQPAVLAELRRIGSCGGTAIAGTLELCETANIVKNPDQCAGTTASLTGNLDGQDIAFTSSSLRGDGLGTPADGRFTELVDAGLRAHVTSSTAVLLMPATGPHANEVLCATASYGEDGTREVWTLTGISQAGSLPGDPVSGELELAECSP